MPLSYGVRHFSHSLFIECPEYLARQDTVPYWHSDKSRDIWYISQGRLQYHTTSERLEDPEDHSRCERDARFKFRHDAAAKTAEDPPLRGKR